jgi:hypothetical protein
MCAIRISSEMKLRSRSKAVGSVITVSPTVRHHAAFLNHNAHRFKATALLPVEDRHGDFSSLPAISLMPGTVVVLVGVLLIFLAPRHARASS